MRQNIVVYLQASIKKLKRCFNFNFWSFLFKYILFIHKTRQSLRVLSMKSVIYRSISFDNKALITLKFTVLN